MKKTISILGILALLVFVLTMFSGCSENKAVVKEEAAQEKATVQATKDEDAERLAREKAQREAEERERAERERQQSARVQAAAAAETVNDINFDFDKSNIRSDAREILKANADFILKNGNAGVVIEGHCDSRGTAEYNMALGSRRAQEAKKYLVNLGIKASMLKTISYGEEKPLDPANNEDAWAKNRRAHFVVKTK